MTLKAISLWQPWASLWVAGIKIHETRARRTYVRGIVAVHAALRRDPGGSVLYYELWQQMPKVLKEKKLPRFFGDLPFGAIVGMVTIADCIPTENVNPAWPDNILGDYTTGRFAWRAEHAHRWHDAVSFKGARGFFWAKLPEDR